jgi:hypothetical protein
MSIAAGLEIAAAIVCGGALVLAALAVWLRVRHGA